MDKETLIALDNILTLGEKAPNLPLAVYEDFCKLRAYYNKMIAQSKTKTLADFAADEDKKNKEKHANQLDGSVAIMPFGKWKGTILDKVPKAYLQWCIEQDWFAEKYPEIANWIERAL